MRIVINSIPAQGLLTGIGRYIRSLYAAIMEIGGCELIFFDGTRSQRALPSPADPRKFISVVDVLGKLPWWCLTWLRIARWLVFEWRLEKLIRNVNASIYHETGFFPAKVLSCPQVFTLYDLSLLKMPQFHPKDRVAFFRFFFQKRFAEADHILTISEFMREEIFQHLSINPQKVTAIHLAPSKEFYPRSSYAVKSAMERYGLKQPFILAVGSIDPRKNLKLILRALALIKRSDLTLVIVGWKGWGYGELKEEVEKIGDRVNLKLLGYVSDEDLAGLYGGASVLVYPSLYEGFGLPILEAMSCGCPVICARTSSLPEVAGNAAIFIDPCSPRELADAITTVLDDILIRRDLIERGFHQAGKFSWDKTAVETLKVFRSLL